MISSLTQTHFVRPRVVVRAKKNDFVEPAEAPGEGKRKQLTCCSPSSYSTEVAHPIKELIKKFFKIEEIDYEKFRKENKWAIRPNQDKAKK